MLSLHLSFVPTKVRKKREFRLKLRVVIPVDKRLINGQLRFSINRHCF